MYLLALSATNPHVTFFKFKKSSMVQWGILLMVVVMKRNRKIVVPPIREGLLWRVPGGTCIITYIATMYTFLLTSSMHTL